MPAKLYKTDASPPARATMMACEVFNVPVEMIDVDLFNKQNFTPEFLKKNPLHTVPVFEDGDLIIHDSHAILIYLADAYGINSSLYPKDLKKRAQINQLLFYDAGTLFNRLRNITYPIFIEGEKGPTQKKLDEVAEAYGHLEEFLSRTKYIAGHEITIADISAIADTTSLLHLLPLNAAKYPIVHAWIKDMEQQPFCQKRNAPGLAAFGEMYRSMLKQ